MEKSLKLKFFKKNKVQLGLHSTLRKIISSTFIALIFLTALVFSVHADGSDINLDIDENKNEFDQTHSKLTKILSNYVFNSKGKTKVRYKDLLKNQNALQEYLNDLSSLSKANYNNFTENQKFAFLVNAYNAFTIKLVLDNYPVNSIKKIGGLLGSPWKINFIELLGKKISLDTIEHEMLRKNFNEPRIHFAVNCASTGCPPIENKAFTAINLEEQLKKVTSVFLNDSTNNYYHPESNTFYLSKIFKWFKKDFEKDGSTLHSFIISQMNSVQETELTKKAYIKYLDYDWSLNE